MNPAQLLPLLVVVFLLVTASGQPVEQMGIYVNGNHAVTAIPDVLVVGGGTATLARNATVNGTMYVIGGTATVDGRLDGRLVQLAGNVSLGSNAVVTGEFQTVAGRTVVADGATVGRRTTIPVTSRQRSPTTDYGFLLVQLLALSLGGLALRRRRPALLRNVGDSVVHHTVVSGVVGALTSAVLLVLFVFMAFTLVLLPVSLLGLAGGLVVVAYAYVVYGYLLGRLLPVARADLSLVTGVVVFVLLVRVLSLVPVLGAFLQLALLLTGIGAILITYFGLREFEPARIPEFEE